MLAFLKEPLKVQLLSQMNIVCLSIASHLHLSVSVQSQLHPLHCAVHTHNQVSDISASSTDSLCSIVPQLKHHSTHQCNVMMTNEMCCWLTLTDTRRSATNFLTKQQICLCKVIIHSVTSSKILFMFKSYSPRIICSFNIQNGKSKTKSHFVFFIFFICKTDTEKEIMVCFFYFGFHTQIKK